MRFAKVKLWHFEFSKTITGLDVFDGPYYRINKFLLSGVGLWPYQSKFERFLCLIIYTLISMTLFVALGMGLILEKKRYVGSIIETTIVLLFVFAGVVKYLIHFTLEYQIKLLYDEIAEDWKKTPDEQEREILATWSVKGRTMSIYYLIYCAVAIILFLSFTFAPTVWTCGTSSYCTAKFPYFYYKSMILFEKYQFHQVVIHMSLAICYVGFFFMAASATFVSSVKHVCGLFDIVCDRIEKVEEHRRKLKGFGAKDGITVKDFVNIAIKHKIAIKGVALIQQAFSIPSFVIELVWIVAMALIMFVIYLYREYPFQFLRLGLVAAAFSIYLFYQNWTGQQIIESSKNVHKKLYFTEWYLISLKARKYLHIMMDEATKAKNIRVGKMYALSFEHFALVVKNCVSFAAVFFSIRHSVEKHLYA